MTSGFFASRYQLRPLGRPTLLLLRQLRRLIEPLATAIEDQGHKFFLVNATYIFLIWELIDRTPARKVSSRVRRIMRLRSIATLCLFGLAAVVALEYPLVGLGICIACLIVYLKPDRRATMLVRGSTRDVRFWHLSDMAKRTLDR